jgi:hypothetical protein
MWAPVADQEIELVGRDIAGQVFKVEDYFKGEG